MKRLESAGLMMLNKDEMRKVDGGVVHITAGVAAGLASAGAALVVGGIAAGAIWYLYTNYTESTSNNDSGDNDDGGGSGEGEGEGEGEATKTA